MGEGAFECVVELVLRPNRDAQGAAALGERREASFSFGRLLTEEIEELSVTFGLEVLDRDEAERG